jgi:hypothetical protein
VKQILLLNLFFSFYLFGQTDTVRLVKSYNFHPMIAQTQFGSIEYWKLCDSAGMQTREDCSIISFRMSYFGKAGFTETQVNGKVIPDEICTEIGVYGIGSMIFFTNIKAMSHETLKIMHLSPMNLTPVSLEK